MDVRRLGRDPPECQPLLAEEQHQGQKDYGNPGQVQGFSQHVPASLSPTRQRVRWAMFITQLRVFVKSGGLTSGLLCGQRQAKGELGSPAGARFDV